MVFWLGDARRGLALAAHVNGSGCWLRCSIHSWIADSSSVLTTRLKADDRAVAVQEIEGVIANAGAHFQNGFAHEIQPDGQYWKISFAIMCNPNFRNGSHASFMVFSKAPP